MALITDPSVIAFVNQVIRPLSDRYVGMNASLDIELAKWFSVISPLMAAAGNDDTVDDGSDTDGRTVLTKADVVNFVTQMLATQTQLDGGGVFDIISKPHVNVIMPA